MTVQHDPKLIEQCLSEVAGLYGDLAEVGVWQGASALCILRHSTDGELYLYDTFCGMPKEMTRDEEHNRPGTWADTSIRRVAELLWEHLERVHFRDGIFPDTLGDEGPFRFVHVDCDQYLSTKAALDHLAPRVVPGGVMLLDDYGCGSTRGARRAADEWLANQGEWALEAVGYRGILRHTEAKYGDN